MSLSPPGTDWDAQAREISKSQHKSSSPNCLSRASAGPLLNTKKIWQGWAVNIQPNHTLHVCFCAAAYKSDKKL